MTILKYNHMKMNWLSWVAIILIIIGGLNWGLVGFFEFDLVGAIFGNMSVISRVVYALVGLAAIYTIFLLPKMNKQA
jgi:uncharacterized protein